MDNIDLHELQQQIKQIEEGVQQSEQSLEALIRQTTHEVTKLESLFARLLEFADKCRNRIDGMQIICGVAREHIRQLRDKQCDLIGEQKRLRSVSKTAARPAKKPQHIRIADARPPFIVIKDDTQVGEIKARGEQEAEKILKRKIDLKLLPDSARLESRPEN